VQIKIEKEMITKAITKPGKWPFFLYLVPIFCVTWVYRKLLFHIYGAKSTVLSCCSGIFVPKYLLNMTGKVFMLLIVS